jgi:hypothetical protein
LCDVVRVLEAFDTNTVAKATGSLLEDTLVFNVKIHAAGTRVDFPFQSLKLSFHPISGAHECNERRSVITGYAQRWWKCCAISAAGSCSSAECTSCSPAGSIGAWWPASAFAVAAAAVLAAVADALFCAVAVGVAVGEDAAVAVAAGA